MDDLVHDMPTGWTEYFVLTSRWTTRPVIRRELTRLRDTIAAREIFEISVPHWFLMYHAIEFRIREHNRHDAEDRAVVARRARLARQGYSLPVPDDLLIGSFKVGPVSLASCLDLFFPDDLDELPLNDMIDVADDDPRELEALVETAITLWLDDERQLNHRRRFTTLEDFPIMPVATPTWIRVAPAQLFRPGVSDRYPDCSEEFLAQLHQHCHPRPESA